MPLIKSIFSEVSETFVGMKCKVFEHFFTNVHGEKVSYEIGFVDYTHIWGSENTKVHFWTIVSFECTIKSMNRTLFYFNFENGKHIRFGAKDVFTVFNELEHTFHELEPTEN